MLRMIVFLLTFFILPASSLAADIATCGESNGYSYDAYRGLLEKDQVGWSEDKIIGGQFTLTMDESGELDLLVSGKLGVSSSVADGAKIIPATISSEAVTVAVIYPNRLVETYIFQKLKNGNYQAMWTQAKAETPIPRITAFVAECSYLDLSILNK